MTVSSSMEVGATCGSTQLQSEYDVKKKENFFTVLCTLSCSGKKMQNLCVCHLTTKCVPADETASYFQLTTRNLPFLKKVKGPI